MQGVRSKWGLLQTLPFAGVEQVSQIRLASRLIHYGLNIYEVKIILVHADIKPTMRYAHLERTDISLMAKQVLDQLNSMTSNTGIDTTFGMNTSP